LLNSTELTSLISTPYEALAQTTQKTPFLIVVKGSVVAVGTYLFAKPLLSNSSCKAVP
jgi:hypothetical protein